MTAATMLAGFDRQRLVKVADWLAVGVAVTLPWSTTATGIFIAGWLIVILATLNIGALRQNLATAAGLLPVLLWVLAAIGMLWADVTWVERLGGLGKFHRLLIIPLLFMQFRRSENGIWVLYGFFASVVALLLVSWGLALIPGLPWRGRIGGCADQGLHFSKCKLSDLHICAPWFCRGQGAKAAMAPTAGSLALALFFLANIFFVVTSRTALLVAPVLLLLLGWRRIWLERSCWAPDYWVPPLVSRFGSVRPTCTSDW